MKCRLCGKAAQKIFTGILLSKYEVDYAQCGHCGFVGTEDPYWLDEAYSKPINDLDTGILIRNTIIKEVVTSLIRVLFGKKGNFLDYGSGYGIFVRLMNDRGFDFSGYDQYATHIFSVDKQVADLGSNYKLITAFEVAEHFVDPMEKFQSLARCSDGIFFTTQLIPSPTPKPSDWWYYGLAHGQHISFYNTSSLLLIAERLGMNYIAVGSNKYNLTFHLMSRKKVNKILFNLVCSYDFTRFINFKRFKI
jgi:hypothetical protein